MPSGTTEMTVVIRDLEHRGGVGFPYRIVAEPLGPEFELATGESEVSVPRGGTAAVARDRQAQGIQRPDRPGPWTIRPPA